MELTRALEKTIRSLAGAKGRRREGAFVAEGTKCVLDTLDAFEVRMILATREWFDNHPLPEAAAAVAVAVWLALFGREIIRVNGGVENSAFLLAGAVTGGIIGGIIGLKRYRRARDNARAIIDEVNRIRSQN